MAKAAETAAETGQADDGETARIRSLEERDRRVDDLSAKVDKILDFLGKGEGKAHEAAAEHEEKSLDRPSSIADEIRRQLDDKRKADEAKAAADADGAWRKKVDDQLAGMTEQAPEPPVRRVEKIMWGKR